MLNREIRRRLEDFQPPNPPADTTDQQKASQRLPSDGLLKAELRRIFGIDLTQIPGIRTGIAQTLFGETGPDFTKSRSASAFASWMGLCPDNDISAGKVLWVGTRKVNCRAATALRMAAQSLHHSKSGLRRFESPHAGQAGCSQNYYRRSPQTRTHYLSSDLYRTRV